MNDYGLQSREITYHLPLLYRPSLLIDYNLALLQIQESSPSVYRIAYLKYFYKSRGNWRSYR